MKIEPFGNNLIVEDLHPIAGYLEVGVDENNEIVINHKDIEVDANGWGFMVFSPEQARYLAQLLERCADACEQGAKENGGG